MPHPQEEPVFLKLPLGFKIFLQEVAQKIKDPLVRPQKINKKALESIKIVQNMELRLI